MDRYNENKIISVCFALTAVAVFAIGQTAHSLGLLILAVLVAGTLMNTAQSSLPAQQQQGGNDPIPAAASWPTAPPATPPRPARRSHTPDAF